MSQAFVSSISSLPLKSTRFTTRTYLTATAPRQPNSVIKCCSTDSAERSNATTRRQFLSNLTMTATTTIAAAMTIQPALADRTGKYSTKLTAKRRYLPRIARGIKALESAAPAMSSGMNWASALDPILSLQDDFLTALKLFGTSYFAEGNRIGPIEKQLSAYVEQIETEFKRLVQATQQNDKDKAQAAYDAISKTIIEYVNTAKIQDSLISFAPK